MSQGISRALMASGSVLEVFILLRLTIEKSKYLRGFPLFIDTYYRS